MGDDFSIPDREFEVIQALNLTSIQYLVIGGYAVLYYGHTNRQVNDLDIWVDNSRDNIVKLVAALQGLLKNNENFCVERLIQPKPIKIDLSNSRYEVELLTMVRGVSFNDSYPKRNVMSQKGDKIDIVSIEDLLAIKRTSTQESEARLHKELKDIGFLESIVSGRGDRG